MYEIRSVPWDDEDGMETILELNRIITPDFPKLKPDDFLNGYWWIAWHYKTAVAYAGMCKSPLFANTAYFRRVGVMQSHRGHGLQTRLIRTAERWAKAVGYTRMVSDTTGTIYSGNNFIKCGYRLFDPDKPWAFSNTLYWTKTL